MKMTDEVALLRRMGADVNLLDSGCCGMAGAFGFEKDKFEISQAIGERVLLPAVRQQSNETLIVADGFSCREQIRQGTGRDAIAFIRGAVPGHKAKKACCKTRGSVNETARFTEINSSSWSHADAR